jgi:hypothetical protein
LDAMNALERARNEQVRYRQSIQDLNSRIFNKAKRDLSPRTMRLYHNLRSEHGASSRNSNIDTMTGRQQMRRWRKIDKMLKDSKRELVPTSLPKNIHQQDTNKIIHLLQVDHERRSRRQSALQKLRGRISGTQSNFK